MITAMSRDGRWAMTDYTAYPEWTMRAGCYNCGVPADRLIRPCGLPDHGDPLCFECLFSMPFLPDSWPLGLEIVEMMLVWRKLRNMLRRERPVRVTVIVEES
jgi:hypothetical protein